jgi:hypothetical protein
MIDFVLDPNELTGEPKKFKAQVVNSRSYTFEDIAKACDKITDFGTGSTS